MTITLTGTANTVTTSGTSLTLVVPAGVQTRHLGIIIVTTSGSDGVAGWSVDGWIVRLQNPTGQSTSEFGLFSRLGGVVAGQQVMVVSESSRSMAVTGLWYDTDGRNIAIIGSPGVRNGANGSSTIIPAITTTAANQDVIVVATERSIAAPTTISSWAPLSPTQDYFTEYAATASTHYAGHFVQATPGTTGTYTVGYTSSAGAAVGVLLGVAPPAAGWIKDPTATGGKRAFVRHRNPAGNEDVDGGVPTTTAFLSGQYDGGGPATVSFFNVPINGGGVNG